MQSWIWNSDAFGNGVPTGTATVNLRMPGQYYDAESGLFYNWNRYYNPATGRYITVDPIGLSGGLNTFAYVSANPVMYQDPEGLNVVTKGAANFIPPVRAAMCGYDLVAYGWACYWQPSLCQTIIEQNIVETVTGVPVDLSDIPETPQTKPVAEEKAEPTTTTGAPIPPDPDDNDNDDDEKYKKPKKKGEDFRGGSKKVRDKWYGQNDKDFQKWWHRKGKDEFNNGRDLQDAKNAREAAEHWKEIGKPKVK